MVDLKKLLSDIAKAIVDSPGEVTVDVLEENDREIVMELKVAATDTGKVIGKHGRIARAIRMIMKSASNLTNKRVIVKIR